MNYARNTSNAVEIIHKRINADPELKKAYEKEKMKLLKKKEILPMVCNNFIVKKSWENKLVIE